MLTKERLKKELSKEVIDFVFLFNEENFKKALLLLEELLEEEKKDFEEKLKIEDEKIDFETFREFSYLDAYFSLIEHLDSVKSTQLTRDIIEKFEPKYIDFSNEIAYSKPYYEMLVFCLENKELLSEQKRILEKDILYYKNRGIHLEAKKQKRLKEISKRLSDLENKFRHNVLDEELAFSYLFQDLTSLEELPEDDKEIAKKRAEQKGEKWYFFDLSYSSYPLIMGYCSERETRKHFYLSRQFLASKWKHNNSEIVREILTLRQEKSEILGYKNYTEYSLILKMADSEELLHDIFIDINTKAQKKAREEEAILKDYFHLEDLEAWDISYYSRKYKKETFHFEAKEFKQYFEFESVLSGLHRIVKKLFDIDIIPLEDKKNLVSYGEDIRIFEVKKWWEILAYFMGDYFYREGKRWGAWENNLREKFISSDEKISPLIVNVCSFQKNTSWETLLSLSDVETIFHEFWHALHEMLTDTIYAELGINRVEWDFVELPSQLFENWVHEQESLDVFAHHHKTGEKVPSRLIEAFHASKTFGSGFMIMWQTMLSLLDLLLHDGTIYENEEQMQKKVESILTQFTFITSIYLEKWYLSFNHIFSWAYASWFYSYLRAELIECQVFDEFHKKGMFYRETAEKYYKTILSQGSKKDAKELFQDFGIGEIKIAPYLERYGIK